VKNGVISPLIGLSKKKFHSYGERLSIIFHQITRSLLKSKNDFDFQIKVLYRERSYLVSSEVNEFPLQTTYIRPEVESFEEKPIFDSSVEEKFFRFFEKEVPKGWTVVHEPEPIIVPETGTLFIPDFGFNRGNIKVFIEIIGFWTENYKKKKKEKLKVLKDYIEDLKLILLIDEKYKDFFSEDFGFPTVFYTSKGIKSIEIINILEQSYSDFNNRLTQLVRETNEIVEKIKNALENKQYISLEELFKILNCYSSEELQKCLEVPAIEDILSQNDLICIPYLFCLKKTTLFEFKESLISLYSREAKKELQLEFIENWMKQNYKFPIKLTGLLDYLGEFEVNWKSIHNPMVKYVAKHE
jgi:hypothetical protein